MPDVDEFFLAGRGENRPRRVGLGVELGVELAVLATRQHGVVARPQLLELGYSSAHVQRLIGTLLLSLHRGVYAVGHRRLSAKGRWMAAVLASGPNAVISHRFALALWGLSSEPTGPIHVTVPGRRRAGRPGLALHNVRTLDAGDTTTLDGIPTTTVARTLLDLAETEKPSYLQYALEAAQRRPGFDYRMLERVAARSPGRHGLKAFNGALAQLRPDPPLTRSKRERLFLTQIERSGLPKPSTNVSVEGETVDFLWAAQKVIVEWDSWEFHKTRRQFETDRRRDTKLQAAGYRILRVTYRRLQSDASCFLEELRSLLDPL